MLLAAGCTAPGGAPVRPLAGAQPAPARLLDHGRVEVAVPVPVILIGFEEGTAAAVASRLTPERVETSWQPFPRLVPPDGDAALRGTVELEPSVALAQYEVREAPASLADALRAASGGWRVPDAPGVLDAIPAEAWLAGALRKAGIAPDACCPALVLLHMGDEGGHGWRAGYENGWIEPVRYFGEREPFGVLDVSARTDPNGHPLVVSPPRAYDAPLPPGGAATVDALVEAAHDAVRYRLLHSVVWPVSTAPCHAVTLVLGVRATALTETLPGYPRATELANASLLRAHFERLTGGTPVLVDLKVVRLPVDDPVLDALTRPPFANTLPVWQWADANWDKYWVPHAGCEPYLSVMVQGDAADPVSGGDAFYAGNWTHRVAVSVVSEVERLSWNQTTPAPLSEGRTRAYKPDWLGYLWAHETGHLLGLEHTQDYADADGQAPSHISFSTGLSAMSYEMDATSDFGAVDQAAFARHRAGWAIQEARAAGLEGTPGFEEALARLAERDWDAAWRALLPALHPHPRLESP